MTKMRCSLVLVLAPFAHAVHYEDPKNGCGSDEQAIQVQGVAGDFCSPPCNGTVCPTDPPSQSDAKPQCALKSSAGSQYCALVCQPGSNAACPTGATCQAIQGTGICTYPGSGPGPAPAPSPGKAGEWTVLNGQFSAVTIGIAFRNDKVGWTTQTSGSTIPAIVKTVDSGASWTPVAQQPASPLPMGVAAKKGSGNHGIVGVTGLGSTMYSLDGDHFNRSLAAVLVSQDIKYQNGQMTLTQPSGPCISSTEGVLFTCHKVPYKYGQTGRYSSSPSANVIYNTAGTWPSKSKAPNDDTIEVTSNLRILRKENSFAYEVGSRSLDGHVQDGNETNQTYTAELWKSSDGGKTWKNLIADKGNFYFNDIHCVDDSHCVAVGEGFANDGSKSPGARVYTTTDGETFKEVHREATTGAESLMAAKMLTTTEHWAGGTTRAGGLTAPLLALHSSDAGKTYTNKHGNVIGQMITAMDFLSSEHGYATTVNALQVSSLLQYGTAAQQQKMFLADNTIVV